MLPIVQAEPVLFNCGHSADGAVPLSATLPSALTPDSDIDELAEIFLDVDVAVDTVPRIESCDLQLGDSWRGMQSKMSVTAPVKKIRKKPDSKPQSQINKCHNEKRRRELENETINQLEELLGTCLAEVKQPDKNGIVREATRQIQEVLKRRRECPSECPLRAPPCRSPLQAGEVTSTQPQPPAFSGLHYSELTTLIEALKHYTGSLGWVLLELNSKGEIECVTENIKELILQDRTELYKKSIFSLIHVNDHPKIRPLLRNIQTFSWTSVEVEKFEAIQVRLLVNNINGTEDSCYAECVIHAGPVRGACPEEAGAVMCVIRRSEDASAALLDDGGPPAIAHKHSDQIIFRLDCNFTILTCDLSGVENCINSPISLVGARYLDLVESSDRARIAEHLQQAVYPEPPAISEPFRLRITSDSPWIKVGARSRLFRAKITSGESDFIMSTHTLLGDDDVVDVNVAQPSVGGPLMTSVANGESSEARYRASISPSEPTFSINDFDLDPWGAAFQLNEMSEEPKERKDSMSDGPPTPRTPATPTEAPSVPEEPNRLRILLSKKPSPARDNGNSNNRILKDLLKQEDEEATSSETSAPHTPHTPHTPLTPHTPHTPAAALSPLHSAPAHARSTIHAPLTPHAPHGPHTPQPANTAHNIQSTHNNSDMLLRILNDKSDEDNDENRRRDSSEGRNIPQSALLTQLLANNGPSNNGRSQDGEYHDRPGLKRKMDDSKGMSISSKRATPETQQVTSSAVSGSCATSTSVSVATSNEAKSLLCQKNQILVSLLARQQSTPTTPPTLPNPSLRMFSSTPRPVPRHPPVQTAHPPRHHPSTHPNLLNQNRSNMNGGGGVVSTVTSVDSATGMQSPQSHLQLVLAGVRSAYTSPSHPQHHSSAAIHYGYNQPPSGNRVQNESGAGDGEVPADQTLSALLDAVIDNMPDADRQAPEVMMDLEATRQHRTNYAMKEKAAINAIRQSLMQCETVTKPASSSPGPPPPPVYPVQSPTGCNMSVSGAQHGTYGMPTRSEPGTDPARARAIAEQQRSRLLAMQSTQQMLVSPEAAEQPQTDLGSTINALVSATPPNVALTRTDYHQQMYHQSQMGSNFGNNKITSSQQNPMLSRQLSVPGSGYGHSAGVPAALHTPLTPQPQPQSQPPYHRAPRPPLVGGYYEEGVAGGYCGEFARRAPHAHPPHLSHPSHPAHPAHDQTLPCTGNGGGVGNVAGTSEYVRNELRAVVGARSHRPDLHQLQPPDLDLMTFDMTAPEYYGGGLGGGGGR